MFWNRLTQTEPFWRAGSSPIGKSFVSCLIPVMLFFFVPVTSLTCWGHGWIAARDQLPRVFREDLGTVCNCSKAWCVN